jgi:hypothetical protein
VVEDVLPTDRKPRRISIKLVAILVGLLAACEVGARVMAVLTRHDEPPKVEDLNLQGFQQMLARVPGAPSLSRIVFLGDSYTRGVAGIKPDQTLVHHVGVLLERWRPGRYVTINLGVSGSDCMGEWGLYNRLRDTARADVVVHVISPRCMDINACKDLFLLQESAGRRCWLSRYSALSDLIESKLRRAAFNRGFVQYLKGGATQQQRESAWRVFSHETIATKKLVEEGGAAYVMVQFPLVGLPGAYPLNDVHQRIAAFAADVKAPYLDLLDAFPGRDTSKMGCWDGDLHPGVQAHVIAGEAVTDFLMQSVLPKIPTLTTNKVGKQRTSGEIAAAESRHYAEILEIEPNCVISQLWLMKYRREAGPPNEQRAQP